MRYTGPLGKEFKGDRQKSMALMGAARVLVGQLVRRLKAPPFNGSGMQFGQTRLADGSVINAWVQMIGAHPIIKTWVDSPVYASSPETYIYSPTSNFGNLIGIPTLFKELTTEYWSFATFGTPFYADGVPINSPLGTQYDSPAQVYFNNTAWPNVGSDATLYPISDVATSPLITQNPGSAAWIFELKSGVFKYERGYSVNYGMQNWIGKDPDTGLPSERDILSWDGPQSRYALWFTSHPYEPTIEPDQAVLKLSGVFIFHKLTVLAKISGYSFVLGAAISRDTENTYLCAVCYDIDSRALDYIRGPITWAPDSNGVYQYQLVETEYEVLHSYTFQEAYYSIWSGAYFSDSGSKAVITTIQHFEAGPDWSVVLIKLDTNTGFSEQVVGDTSYETLTENFSGSASLSWSPSGSGFSASGDSSQEIKGTAICADYVGETLVLLSADNRAQTSISTESRNTTLSVSDISDSMYAVSACAAYDTAITQETSGIRFYTDDESVDFTTPKTTFIQSSASYEGCLDFEVYKNLLDPPYGVLLSSTGGSTHIEARGYRLGFVDLRIGCLGFLSNLYREDKSGGLTVKKETTSFKLYFNGQLVDSLLLASTETTISSGNAQVSVDVPQLPVGYTYGSSGTIDLTRAPETYNYASIIHTPLVSPGTPPLVTASVVKRGRDIAYNFVWLDAPTGKIKKMSGIAGKKQFESELLRRGSNYFICNLSQV